MPKDKDIDIVPVDGIDTSEKDWDKPDPDIEVIDIDDYLSDHPEQKLSKDDMDSLLESMARGLGEAQEMEEQGVTPDAEKNDSKGRGR